GLPSGSYQITATAPGFQSTRSTISYDPSHPVAYQIGLNIGTLSESIVVSAKSLTIDTENAQIFTRKEKKNKNTPQPAAAPPPPPPASANVYNLQQRATGILPITPERGMSTVMGRMPVDIPRSGVSYRFLRPLVLNEETKLNFAYKSK